MGKVDDGKEQKHAYRLGHASNHIRCGFACRRMRRFVFCNKLFWQDDDDDDTSEYLLMRSACFLGGDISKSRKRLAVSETAGVTRCC